jgi:UDP-N-acetylglucosamine--N-acetylmuramyl-(pentapeptide) pyrophosphoryl-undecaprenol N-acetylglucosamine transferase
MLAAWDRITLLTMAENARKAAIPDATERVAREVMAAAKV